MKYFTPYSPHEAVRQAHDNFFCQRQRLTVAFFFQTLVLCWLCLCGTALAAEPIRVVYGFDREFPPFSYEEAGGKATGFEVELMQAVFAGSEAELFYRPLQWERVTLELSSGTINLTTGMVRTEQRSKLYLFSKLETFPLQIRLFTKIYNRFPSALLLRGQMVSVEQGSYQHRLLEEVGGFNIKPFASRVDGLRALYADEVAAYCAPVQSAYYYINKLNYGAITTVGTPLGITEMRAAVARDRGDILRLLDEGMARVKESGEYHRLYRKWFVRELSDQERDLMLRTATGAAIPAYAPYGKKGQGAAVLTATGKVYSACTVENADLSLSLSALHAAVARAIADGEFELRAAVITNATGAVQTPGPEDLQVLSEFGMGVLVIGSDKPGSYQSPMVAELLPKPVSRETGLIQTE
ncbi:transporter substrate-binding domain-containing protein [Desulfovibrio sp. OttesenSCG-928-M14]|nr:transporter substrate-binding domain-containing protein [Desulfovibrio sp. OttesenSCG-928-M14]